MLFIEDEQLKVFQPWEDFRKDKDQYRIFAGVKDHLLMIVNSKLVVKYDLSQEKWIGSPISMERHAFSLDLTYDKNENLYFISKVGQDVVIGDFDSIKHFSNAKYPYVCVFACYYSMGIPGRLYHVEGIYINVRGDYTEKASHFLLPTAAGNFQLVHLNEKHFTKITKSTFY